MSVINITKLSADEFSVRQLSANSREYTYTCKLVGKALKADAYHLGLTSDFVRKPAPLKIGDTIAWEQATRKVVEIDRPCIYVETANWRLRFNFYGKECGPDGVGYIYPFDPRLGPGPW
jgi:hypothetical protein